MRSRLEAKLRRAEVVSFDVFDTAILRPLVRPDDLFLLMQSQVSNILGADIGDFRSARVTAEHIARRRAWETRSVAEVTLDEIYQALGTLLQLDALAARKISELEIEAEKAVCRQNPFIYSLYRRCIDRRQRIAFISDTYLPEPVIADLLRRSGYHAYDTLLVSSAVGKTKATGHLYEEAHKRIAVRPRRWLHIGDNRQSDIRMARKRGMATWHYQQCAEKSAEDRQFAAAWKNQGPASASGYVVQGLVINRLTHQRPISAFSGQGKNFWEDLGYTTAGPLFVGFIEWIIERAAALDLQGLYFLARDGLIMQRVYEALRPPGTSRIETHYLHASRRAMNFAAIKAIDEDALTFLMQNYSTNEAARFLQRIGLDWRDYADAFREAGFDDPRQKVIKSRDIACLKRLFMLLAQPICERAGAERAVLQDYLVRSGLHNGRRVALVDVGWHGTQQQSIVEILRESGQVPHITGLYLGTGTAAPFYDPRYAHETYLFRLGQPREYAELMLTTSVEVVELMFSATEGSVIRIERDARGEFVPVRQIDASDEYRKESVRRLQEGAMQFVDDYLALKRNFPDLSMRRETAVAQLRRVLEDPTPVEARYLGDIPHARDFGDSTRHPIAPRPSSLTLLKGRRAVWRHYRDISWKIGSHARASPLYRALYRLMMH